MSVSGSFRPPNLRLPILAVRILRTPFWQFRPIPNRLSILGQLLTCRAPPILRRPNFSISPTVNCRRRSTCTVKLTSHLQHQCLPLFILLPTDRRILNFRRRLLLRRLFLFLSHLSPLPAVGTTPATMNIIRFQIGLNFSIMLPRRDEYVVCFGFPVELGN